MAGRRSERRSYIADPGRREQLRTLRTIRMQVYKEREKEFAEAGFLKRIFLRLRIEREIRRRSREAPAHPAQ